MAYKILFIGAHHEEIEAECPNLAAAFALAGCEVTILNPIGGWNWVAIRNLGPDGRERTIRDAVNAARELGCEKVIWDYPVASANRFAGEIMDRMAEFVQQFNPDIVLMHWPKDTHADHRLIAKITRHVLETGPNLTEKRFPDYHGPSEVYAYQTGPAQAYHFIPDFVINADEETMKRAKKCIDCFNPTMPRSVKVWEKNFRTKAGYWGNYTREPAAEALKFMGPALPPDGFLLKKILGNRVVPTTYELYYYNPDLEL